MQQILKDWPFRIHISKEVQMLCSLKHSQFVAPVVTCKHNKYCLLCLTYLNLTPRPHVHWNNHLFHQIFLCTFSSSQVLPRFGTGVFLIKWKLFKMWFRAHNVAAMSWGTVDRCCRVDTSMPRKLVGASKHKTQKFWFKNKSTGSPVNEG